MAFTVDGSNGLTFPDSTNMASATALGMRNRIINGAMVIDQRNAGASINNGAGGLYSLDRWATYGAQASKFSIQQNAGSVTPPAGFKNYLGITSLSAYTVGASESFSIRQYIEGFNTADLNFGSASAVTVTLSFWVRSSLTGSFGGCFYNSAGDRFYAFGYTINSANTWEYKTITLAGDTTGTWIGATNGIGIVVQFSLGAGASVSGSANSWTSSTALQPTGATSVVGTNGATFYLTGVQFERGTQATPFDWRPYPVELNMCYRYYSKVGGTNGNEMANVGSFQCYSSTQTAGSLIYPVEMRASPTLGYSAVSDWVVTTNVYGTAATTAISAGQIGTRTLQLICTIGSASLTAGNATNMQAFNINARLTLSAEL